MNASVAAPPRLLDGLGEIADAYDVLLCDVWGVVHDGRRAFPDAVAALERFRAGGGTVVLLTNAPRPHDAVAAQIASLGVPRDAYDAIVTSGDATVALIVARGEAPAFHIGPPRDEALFAAVRAKAGRPPRLAPLGEAGYVICTGLFDDTAETPDDYTDLLETARGRGLDMICANPDVVVHVGDRVRYCGGAIAERYAGMGGAVLYAGKPHAPIYRVALEVAAGCRGRPVAAPRVLAVGDGLPTDVAGARGQGLDCLFVTTGIHRAETIVPDTGRLHVEGLARLLDAAGARPAGAITHLAW